MTTPSPAFQRFMASFDGPITSKREYESFDLGALAELNGAEKLRARDALIRRLKDGVEDPRVVAGLLEIGDETAFDALKAGLDNAAGLTRVTIAHSLVRRGDRIDVSAALRAAGQSEAPSIRMAAASATTIVDDPELDAWLLELIQHDEDSEVRVAAQLSLYQRNGLSGVTGHYGSLFFSVTMSTSHRFPRLRKVAVDQLKQWLDQLREGETPDSLGLTDKPPVDMKRLEGFWALATAQDSTQTRHAVAELIDGANAAEARWMTDFLAGFVGRLESTWAAYGLGLLDGEFAELAKSEALAAGAPGVAEALRGLPNG